MGQKYLGYHYLVIYDKNIKTKPLGYPRNVYSYPRNEESTVPDTFTSAKNLLPSACAPQRYLLPVEGYFFTDNLRQLF